jgi:hypothetical protein
MAMNGLANLAEVLERGGNEIKVDAEIAARARHTIQRMLDFAKGLDLAAPRVRNAPGNASGLGPA